MIFIYPALISENVEKQFVPVVLKSMEKYFAFHISESFKMGTISVDAYEKKKNQWTYVFSSRKKGKFTINDSLLHEDYTKDPNAKFDLNNVNYHSKQLISIASSMEDVANDANKYVTGLLTTKMGPDANKAYYTNIRKFEADMAQHRKTFDGTFEAFKSARDNFKKMLDGAWNKKNDQLNPGYSGFANYGEILGYYDSLNRRTDDAMASKTRAEQSESRFASAKVKGDAKISTAGDRSSNPIIDLKNIIASKGPFEDYQNTVNKFVTVINYRVTQIRAFMTDPKIRTFLTTLTKNIQEFDVLTDKDIATLKDGILTFEEYIIRKQDESSKFFQDLYNKYEEIQSKKSSLVERLNYIESNVDPTNKQLAKKVLAEISRMDAPMQSAQDQLKKTQEQYASYLDNARNKVDELKTKMGVQTVTRTQEEKKKNEEEKAEKERLKNVPDYDKIKDKKTGKWREKTTEEKLKDEEAQKIAKSKTMAGGRIDISKEYNIDLMPETTDTQVNVEYHYINGKSETGQITIPLGVKINPMIVRNADQMYNLLIDDATTTRFKFLYRAVFRMLLRVKNRWVGKIKRIFNILNPLKKLDVNPGAMSVDFYNDIVLGDKGFVDASSFKGKSRTASTFQYAAAIVVMDSSDLTEQVNNFLSDPSKVRRLFILGWNTFAVMDNPNQKMVFCSYIEGGTCTELPYAYVFNTGGKGLGKMFEDMDTLKQQTMPFRLKRGNMISWARKFANRQLAAKSIDNKLSKYGA